MCYLCPTNQKINKSHPKISIIKQGQMNEENPMNQLKNQSQQKQDTKYSLKYQLRINNQNIGTIKSDHGVFTFGRFEENDINDQDISISRIQCFIFIINDNLYIMDGWSLCGTRTVSINGNKCNLKHSVPNNRMLLRFNRRDIIHLQCGDENPKTGLYIDLIINPKECIICRDKARVIRNSCGHYILCNDCYYTLNNKRWSRNCPLCGKPIRATLIENKSIATYHQPSINQIIYH